VTRDAPDCDVSGYDAVVYDLDGTLVHLAVDWDAAATEVAQVFDEHDEDAPADLDRSDEVGLRDPVEAVLSRHEREGGRLSERLALADCVPQHALPVGVCSLNCEAACRVALETHDIDEAVGAVVGRDTVATRKPDPEPLLTTLDRLSAGPEAALFVGDSRRDEETARRAGVDFRYVAGGPSDH
jgi:phosphoglycolate phosphatase